MTQTLNLSKLTPKGREFLAAAVRDFGGNASKASGTVKVNGNVFNTLNWRVGAFEVRDGQFFVRQELVALLEVAPKGV